LTEKRGDKYVETCLDCEIIYPMNYSFSVSQRARLGVLIILLLSVLGGRFFWVSIDDGRWFSIYLGYYVVLALLIIGSTFFVREGKCQGWFGGDFWGRHRGGILAVAGASVFLHVHEPHVFRVLYDEPSHALTAMVMHIEKQALSVEQSNYVGDVFVLSRYFPSFRQYLFPLLVSLLHDFTGFRLANAFICNSILTPALLLGAYFLAHQLGGKLAGWISVLLLGSLPLLAQVVTSGAYDVLNLVLLALLLLFTIRYYKSVDKDFERWMNLSLATALLLAVTRTESILYLLPWAMITVVLWWQQRAIRLTWFAVVSPFFILPNLMTNLIMIRTGMGTDLQYRKNGEAFFSIAYLPKHLSEAVYYFFNPSNMSTSSPLLAGLGGVGIIALLVHLIKTLRAKKIVSQELIFGVFVVWAMGIYLFILTNFWGSPTEVLAARFSLPLQLVCSVAAGWLIVQFAKLKTKPTLVIACLVLWMMLSAAPSASKAFLTYGSTTTRAEEWYLKYAATRSKERTLYAARSNIGFIVQGYAASMLYYLDGSPETFVRAIKAGLYQDVIVLQALHPDPKTGSWVVGSENKIAENIVLETIDERFFSPEYKARISRLVGYRKPDGTLVVPSSNDEAIALKQAFASQADWYPYYYSLYP
jgi:hypothetical protein